MPLAYPIAPSQTDAKSPVDQDLTDSIRLDLEDLDSRVAGSGVGGLGMTFKVNGFLSLMANNAFTDAQSFTPRYRLDGAIAVEDKTLLGAKLILENGGDGGTIEADILRYTRPNIAVTGLTRLFTAPVVSIGRTGSALSTQSIARSTAQLSTQSIDRFKASISIMSIVPLGAGYFRINLSSAPDADWVAGTSVTVSSASNAANNGSFDIVRANEDGAANVVIYNAAGVQQATAAGNLELNLWKLTFVNPVPTEFAAREVLTAASHTDAANNGQFEIYGVNLGGNTIVVKSSTMQSQNSPAGNVNVNRWVYSFASPVTTDYAVGDYAEFNGHTSIGNDGNKIITGVNQGGNNIVVYNASGAVQGSPAGTTNTRRWTWTFATDPAAAGVQVGDRVESIDAIHSDNRQLYTVRQLNRAAGFNIVVHARFGGVDQPGGGGSMYTLKTLAKFASAVPGLSTDSVITLQGTARADKALPYAHSDGDFPVLEVNRGGGSNFNAVIETQGPEQVGPAGRIVFEAKSVFDTKPSAVIPAKAKGFSATAGVVSTNAVLNDTRKVITTETLLMLAITKIPNGDCKNLTVQLV